jgi:hypothetical protein
VTAYKPIETIDKTALFAKFLDDSRTIFRYIRARAPSAFLGIHTTPTIRWGMTLFHQYQNAVRRLARESDELFLFDFQLLVRAARGTRAPVQGRGRMCAPDVRAMAFCASWLTTRRRCAAPPPCALRAPVPCAHPSFSAHQHT